MKVRIKSETAIYQWGIASCVCAILGTVFLIVYYLQSAISTLFYGSNWLLLLGMIGGLIGRRSRAGRFGLGLALMAIIGGFVFLILTMPDLSDFHG